MRTCTGLTCPFPNPAAHGRSDWWTCPRCGTRYRLSRQIRQRWWRNWKAPAGEWRRRFGTWSLDRALRGQAGRWPSPSLDEEPGAARRVGIGVAPPPAEPAGAFGRWAMEQGILPKVNEEQAAVLMWAFVAGYRHAMAINEAELEIVRRAGYDVFRAGGARSRGRPSWSPRRRTAEDQLQFHIAVLGYFRPR